MAAELLSKVEKSFWKQGRLATFTNWPHEAGTCTPERMAAAGFYAVDGADEHDTAECFICGKQLDGWDADDDPWQEHAKHQSDCPFVLLGKQDELQWTVEELYTLVKAYYVNKKTREMNIVIEMMKRDTQLGVERIRKLYAAQCNSKRFGK